MNSLLSQPPLNAYTVQDVYDLIENSDKKYLELQVFDSVPHIRAAKANNAGSEDEKTKKLSKLLSFVLRHGALELGLEMGSDG